MFLGTAPLGGGVFPTRSLTSFVRRYGFTFDIGHWVTVGEALAYSCRASRLQEELLYHSTYSRATCLFRVKGKSFSPTKEKQ